MSDAMRESRPNEAVCLALYSAANATVQLYRELLAPWGLSYQQLMVLGLLWEEGEATPGRIAETLMADSSSVAGLLRRLQASGLIDRDVDPGDRRRVRVVATARSRQISDELGWLEDCVTRAIGLDHAQARELVTSLHGLRARLAAFPRPEQLTPATAVSHA